MRDQSYAVVMVTFFGNREVARYPTREQAEWKAQELNEWAERNPRGGLHYIVRPARERDSERGSDREPDGER